MNFSKTYLALLAAWLGTFASKAGAIPPETVTAAPLTLDDLNPVQLRPQNRPGDNMFAAHRSHSSHRSHGSSSGGGGGYAAPTPSYPTAPAAPQRSPTPDNANSLSGGNEYGRPTSPGRAAPVSPEPAAPILSTKEMRELQIMRVQISLMKTGLYEGPVDGNLSTQTKESLKLFQKLKGLPTSGLMTTDTLTALGIPAVQ